MPPHPEAEPVTGDRARDRVGADRAERQGPGTHQGTSAEHHGNAWHDHADHGEGLGQGNEKDRRPGKLGVLDNPAMERGHAHERCILQ